MFAWSLHEQIRAEFGALYGFVLNMLLEENEFTRCFIQHKPAASPKALPRPHSDPPRAGDNTPADLLMPAQDTDYPGFKAPGWKIN